MIGTTPDTVNGPSKLAAATDLCRSRQILVEQIAALVVGRPDWATCIAGAASYIAINSWATTDPDYVERICHASRALQAACVPLVMDDGEGVPW